MTIYTGRRGVDPNLVARIEELSRQEQASKPKRQKPAMEMPYSDQQLAALESLHLPGLDSPLHLLRENYWNRRAYPGLADMCNDAIRSIRNVLAGDRQRALELAEQISEVEKIL